LVEEKKRFDRPLFVDAGENFVQLPFVAAIQAALADSPSTMRKHLASTADSTA
jgi:hypothetical protein